MDKAHADHGLAHWRKKLSKAAPASIPRWVHAFTER
jgi:hypothetical protein